VFLTLAIAVTFAAGVGVFALRIFPSTFAMPFAGLYRKRALPVTWLRSVLTNAGIYDEAPQFALIALIVFSLFVGAFLAVMVGNPFVILLGFPIVIIPCWLYLKRLQSRFLERAQNEIVPFLSRVQASVRANEPSATAYRAALTDPSCKLLRRLLADSASSMQSGTPFVKALRETTAKVPMNMWVDFVDQMELHASTGGNIADAIAESIKGINEQVALQAEGKAAYAREATQQKAILAMVIVGLGASALKVNSGSFSLMYTTPIGIVISVLGVSGIVLGIWFGKRSMNEIKEWIGF
jgi:Flp pilus assembly protein TadB